MVRCPACGRVYTATIPLTCACGQVISPETTDTLPGNPASYSTVASQSQMDREPTLPLALRESAWPDQTTTTPQALPRTSPARRTLAPGQERLWRWIAGGSVIVNAALLLAVLLLTVALIETHPLATTTGGVGGQTSRHMTVSPTPTKTSAVILGMQSWSHTASCMPTGQSLYVIGVDPHDPGFVCLAPAASLVNGHIQVATTFLQGGGDTALGLALRARGEGSSLSDDEVYLRQDGQVMIIQRIHGQEHPLFPAQPAAAILTGQGATNSVAVTLQGANITVAINGIQMAAVTDAANAQAGAVGVVVGHAGQEGLFSNFTLEQTS